MYIHCIIIMNIHYSKILEQATFVHVTKIFNIVYSQTKRLQYEKDINVLIVSVINVYDYYSQSVYYDNV